MKVKLKKVLANKIHTLNNKSQTTSSILNITKEQTSHIHPTPTLPYQHHLWTDDTQAFIRLLQNILIIFKKNPFRNEKQTQTVLYPTNH